MSQDGYAVFTEQFPEFMKVYRRIAKTDWFQQGGWTAFIGSFTHGIYMQVFKPHWFNAELDGIHFELAMNRQLLDNRIANLQLHITHKSVLPDRDAFNAATIPLFKRAMSDWDAKYELSETKPSERVNLNIPYTNSTFAAKVGDEIGRVCELGAIIDDTLRDLWDVTPA
ncbi:MAG: hypothetical protein O3A46_03515 [Candidatus Poribacteria bacterium]|nr:hypothetical protein [Candidatus Poribacteria bacterium]